MDVTSSISKHTLISAFLLPLLLGGCLMNETVEEQAAGSPTGDVNSAPTISGSPPRVVKVGVNYSFTPTAADADADKLSFTIVNQPGWTDFDVDTGTLSGVPFLGSEDTYNDIVITVSDGTDTASLAAFSITVEPSTSANMPPEISGNPPGSVTVGQTYSFMPTASDPDGDTLTFGLTGAPAWLTVSSGTGVVTGMPQSGDVGSYTGIVLYADDGQSRTELPAFSILVNDVPMTGSVTLSWTAPTQNTDGSPLTDLAGYRIYYGTSPGNYTQQPIVIDNPGLTSYVVDNLAAGTYYFVSTSVNLQGIQSDYSNVATKTVTP